MPTPAPSQRASQVQAAVYSQLVDQYDAAPGEKYPLHVGDTWLAPPPGCDVTDVGDVPGSDRYTAVTGWPDLLDAARARVASRTGHPVAADGVFACAGATAGLAVVVLAMVDPGAQVLILAPAWPLFANMVRLAGGEATHVPFLDVTHDEVEARLDAAATDRAVAIYVNTPNNPSGQILSAEVLAAIAAWAERRGVWIVADEVYEDLQFEGEHTPIRRLAPDRTVNAYSFSKAYGMAGYRGGYVAGPPSLVAAAARLSTYTYYCAPFPAQIAGLRALGPNGDAWLGRARAAYAEVGREAARRLGVASPAGGTFLFVDVGPSLDFMGMPGLLWRCAERGLLVAPGAVFGPYPNHIRVCYTAVAPEVTLRGIDLLASILGR